MRQSAGLVTSFEHTYCGVRLADGSLCALRSTVPVALCSPIGVVSACCSTTRGGHKQRGRTNTIGQSGDSSRDNSDGATRRGEERDQSSTQHRKHRGHTASIVLLSSVCRVRLDRLDGLHSARTSSSPESKRRSIECAQRGDSEGNTGTAGTREEGDPCR